MRGQDDEPSDTGQYGVSVSYVADWLNAIEFGLYYINYHEHIPGQAIDLSTFRYFLTYPEDVKLYGASFSMQVMKFPLLKDWNISGEISYRHDFPIDMESPSPFLIIRENANILQAQVSGIMLYPKVLFADSVSVICEIGGNRVLGIDNDRIPDTKDKSAWGAVISVKPSFLAVFNPQLDIAIPVTWKINPMGTSVVAGTFTEGADSLSLGVDFTYAVNYRLSLKYVDYFNTVRNSSSDRDHFLTTFKFSF